MDKSLKNESRNDANFVGLSASVPPKMTNLRHDNSRFSVVSPLGLFYIYCIYFQCEYFATKAVRLDMDCTVANSWCEIDAVMIVGEPSNEVCYIDGLVQDCSNSSALAMELLQSYTKPSTWTYAFPSKQIHGVIK